VADLLGLARTSSSGNKFYDPGDAVSRSHYSVQRYRLYAECKSTIQKSYSLKRDDLERYSKRAAENGKMYVMPIRFVGAHDDDYVVMRLLDFSDVLEAAQQKESPSDSVSYLWWMIGKIRDNTIRQEAEKHFRKILGE
jgi:hypothetical protein